MTHPTHSALEAALLAVRTEATPLGGQGGWLLSNDTFEKVRAALEGDWLPEDRDGTYRGTLPEWD